MSSKISKPRPWRNLTIIFILMSLAGIFGFFASVTGHMGFVSAQAVVWFFALALLLRAGREP